MNIVPLDEIATFKSGGTPSKSKPAYWGGDFPWITAKDLKSPVITNSIDRLSETGFTAANIAPKDSLLVLVRGMTLYKDVPVCLTGRDMAFNQDIKALVVSDAVSPKYLQYYLQSKKKELLELVDSAGHGTGRLDTNHLKNFPISLPSLEEQTAIADLLSTWDLAIEKTERLIEKKEKQFEAIIQKLLIHNKRKDNWQNKLLSEFIVERSDKSTTNNQYPVITSSRRGIFLQEEYFSKQVASSNNTGYKLIYKGDFTFRSMSDDGMFIFNRLLVLDAGIISPAYGVFYTKDINSSFLYYFLNSNVFAHQINRQSQGGTRTALKLSAIKSIRVRIPDINEQNQIAHILDLARREIELLRTQVDSYRKQKHSLMQKLLTCAWRTKERSEVAI